MIIRILPSLRTRQQWIEFCRRETPYCFVETPDSLIDFQSSHLIISLLNRQVRNGKQAIKYSIGSRYSMEPAWRFIKASQFSLERMIQGLESLDFQGNARDNSLSGLVSDVNIRKFFAKEQAVISPAFLGTLDPLIGFPEFWDLHNCCRLLANQQYRDLRSEKQQLGDKRPTFADASAVVVKLVENPDHWKVRLRDGRLWFFEENHASFSLSPDLNPLGRTLTGPL